MSTLDAVLNLEPHHCRYPFGEGAKISLCGSKRVSGLPYCEQHARQCFTRSVDVDAEVFTAASKNLEPVSQRILEDVA